MSRRAACGGTTHFTPQNRSETRAFETNPAKAPGFGKSQGMKIFPLLLAAVSLASPSVQSEDARFPFVIPGDDAEKTATDFSWLNAKPAGADGFVTIRDGHFYEGKERLRIWGVNTCFSASFPPHEDAEKVAAHLAKLGVNAVRVHHHDSAPAPRGLLAPARGGQRAFDPAMLDRQDYFLDQLARRGIYANLNLHVGRTFTAAEGFPADDLGQEFHYDKFILYFDPRMRVLFKEFCREYLGHVNPYRRLSRADDPSVALVEITNENSFSTKGPAAARRLPKPYRDEFARQWNEWLKAKYRTSDGLKAAWNKDAEPPGEFIARMDGSTESFKAWKLHQSRERPLNATAAQAGPAGKPDAVRIQIPKAAAQLHEHEIALPNVSLRKDRGYTLSFFVRAERTRRLIADVSRQGPGAWGSLGYAADLQVGPEWKRVTGTFRATEDADRGARICLKFGGSDAGLWIANLALREGGQESPLCEGESIEGANIDIPDSGWPAPSLADVKLFMVQTEEGFIRDLVHFLKKDVGVKVPITASQITYHTPSVLVDTCDYTDIHAYWQHPRFPGKPWDRSNWTIPNTPMEADPARNVLFERSVWRIFDRPFTISEWDIPSPSDYAASTAPFAALVASLQDWDGVFFFDYCSDTNAFFNDKINGYFSLTGHPAQLAMLGAFGAMYRRGDLAPLRERVRGALDQRGSSGLAMSHLVGIDPKLTAPEQASAPAGARFASPGGQALNDATDKKQAFVQVVSPATRAIWGLVGGREFDLGGLKFRVGNIDRDYAAVICTSLDGRPVEKSSRLLLAAVGSAENQGMKWNESRTTVGTSWGRGPTMVNGIPLDVELNAGVKSVHVLDGRGRRTGEVRVAREAGASRFHVGPDFKTLWYEIERDQ